MAVKLYGLAELAQAAGVQPRTLSGYLARGKCPEPSYRLECGPVWTDDDVAEWLERRDERIRGIIAEANAQYDAAVQALYDAEYSPDRVYTAKANVHNGRLRRQWRRGHGGLSEADLERSGLLRPTHKNVVRRAAESVVSEGWEVPTRARWAERMMQRRQAVRTGDPDGIPF